MQKNIQKGTNGITLIALIITIIVLLILAGVTISQLTGSDSAPAKANEASQKNAIGEAKDDVAISVQNAQMDAYNSVYVDGTGVGTSTPVTKGNASTTVGDYVIRTVKAKYDANSKVGSATVEVATNGKVRVYTTDFEETGTINATGGVLTWNGTIANSGVVSDLAGKTASTSNRTLSGVTTGYSSKNPVIPQGFKAVDVGNATWTYTDSTNTVVTGWNNGLVIQDAENGNQFVWVPCTTASDNNFATSGIVSYAKNFNAYPKNSDLTLVSDATDSTNEYSAVPVTETIQIGNYGGFYVARFEAGLTTASSNSSNNTVGTPLSKEGIKVWNWVDYNTSYKSANSMINNTTKYGNNKSGLITGTQWDTIMQWYENSNPSIPVLASNQNWGTYKTKKYDIEGWYFTHNGSSGSDWLDASSSKVTHNECSASANISDSNKAYFHASGLNKDSGYQKNIADLGGNLWEWTAEVYSSDRVLRGGNAYRATSTFPASYRSSGSTSNTSDSLRFPCRNVHSIKICKSILGHLPDCVQQKNIKNLNKN